MIETILLAIVLFASTNIDDIFVLLAFFADPKFHTSSIVLGQYFGISVLMGVSVAASLVSLVLSPEHVGLLGLAPVVIGLKKIIDLFRPETEGEIETSKAGSAGAVASVAGVTMANGGDNIGVYVPDFATHNAPDLVIIAAVFAGMTAAWLFAGHALVNHPRLGAPIRRYGHRVVPFVLLALGLYVLREAGSIRYLAGLFGVRA